MSRRTFNKFEYFEPKSLNEAISLKAEYGEKGKVLAGGTDIFPMIRGEAIAPDYIINLKKIPDMRYITKDNKENLIIGALTTVREIEKSDLILEEYQALYEGARSLGSVKIRNLATIGGNVCRAAPSGDLICPLYAMGAEFFVAGPDGRRGISAENFFTGPGQTAMKTGEILIEIKVPKLPRNTGTAFLKIGRLGMDLAKVNVSVVLTLGDEVCKNIKIALGAVAPTPIRARGAEEVIKGNTLNEDIIKKASELVTEEIRPITDVRSTSEYRRAVSAVLVKRAIKKALERAG